MIRMPPQRDLREVPPYEAQFPPHKHQTKHQTVAQTRILVIPTERSHVLLADFLTAKLPQGQEIALCNRKKRKTSKKTLINYSTQTWHTSHHTSHITLYTLHFTLHFTLHTYHTSDITSHHTIHHMTLHNNTTIPRQYHNNTTTRKQPHSNGIEQHHYPQKSIHNRTQAYDLRTSPQHTILLQFVGEILVVLEIKSHICIQILYHHAFHDFEGGQELL